MEVAYIEKTVRPRFDWYEIHHLYRLIDAEYWRERDRRKWDKKRGDTFMKEEIDARFKRLCKFRRKMLKLVNSCRKPNHQLTLKQRF